MPHSIWLPRSPGFGIVFGAAIALSQEEGADAHTRHQQSDYNVFKARIDDRRGYLALSGVTFLARSDRRIIHFCTQVGIQEIKL
jgi:hypothetical protein